MHTESLMLTRTTKDRYHDLQPMDEETEAKKTEAKLASPRKRGDATQAESLPGCFTTAQCCPDLTNSAPLGSPW